MHYELKHDRISETVNVNWFCPFFQIRQQITNKSFSLSNRPYQLCVSCLKPEAFFGRSQKLGQKNLPTACYTEGSVTGQDKMGILKPFV